jgi:hypothetical protein
MEYHKPQMGSGFCRPSVQKWHAALNQFNKALDKNQASTLFKLLLKYQPEAKADKRERLLKEAEAREAGKVRLFFGFARWLQAEGQNRRRTVNHAHLEVLWDFQGVVGTVCYYPQVSFSVGAADKVIAFMWHATKLLAAIASKPPCSRTQHTHRIYCLPFLFFHRHFHWTGSCDRVCTLH